jgi:hypothetical protein
MVLVALGLRGYRLGSPALWVDEVESTLNALTIVADGLPGDTYLGQPLYENTLMRPWPGHAEYEFRDLSYSDRGLAVYHAWLPLYAIAAAFRVAGVSSAEARLGPPLQNASLADLEYWTAVPRAPALLFSPVLVVAACALGRAVHGPAVAAGLALAVATANFFVWAGRQARYYSAALALDALCGLAIWHAWRRGRLRDHALAGLSIGALFHAHSVSAVAMTAVYIACVPDPILGQAIKAVVLTDAPLTAEQVLAHCRAHLEEFMVPRHVEFRDSLPMTETGKIKKSELI